MPFESNRGNDLTRDKVSLRTGTFVIDVPDGNYDVDIYLGQVRKSDSVRITVEGTADTFVPQDGPNVVRSFLTTVSDDQLTIEFDGLGGLNNRIQIAGIGLEEVDNRPGLPLPEKTSILSPDVTAFWQTVTLSEFELPNNKPAVQAKASIEMLPQ